MPTQLGNKTRQLSSADPRKVDNTKRTGEYTALAVQQSGRSYSLKKGDASGSMVQSLYGGKKPA